MRTKIIKIGNSRGIRIPSPILKESGLKNEVELMIDLEGLVIRPIKETGASPYETILLSESALAKDWNRVEEDEAWANL